MIGADEIERAMDEVQAVYGEHQEADPLRMAGLDSIAVRIAGIKRAARVYEVRDIERPVDMPLGEWIVALLSAAWVDGAMVGARAARLEDRGD